MEGKFDVFISHNSRDKPIVRQLADCLMAAGNSVWLDEKDLTAGLPWLDEIEKALSQSCVIVVAVGASGLGSWETPEVRAALIQMVRRQTPVIPVLLPEAPDQVELPLFLQTLTWVDCRQGFRGAQIEQISTSVRIAKSSGGAVTRNVQMTVPPRPTQLAEFWRFLSDFDSVFGWAIKASFAAPLAPVAVGLGPPWDGTSPLAEKATIVLLTAIVQILAVTGAFFIFPPMQPNKVRRILATALISSLVAMFAYLLLFVLLTELQPEQSNRMISGWWYSERFIVTLLDGGDIETAKLGCGYKPLQMYVPWTVWVSFFLVLFSWLGFFASIIFYLGLFVKHIAALRQDAQVDDRALVTLGLSSGVLKLLHESEIHTVGDLCALSERQVRHSLRGSDEKYAELISALNKIGINLRQYSEG